MNNAVVKHIRKEVETLTFDIDMLGHEVASAEAHLRSKQRAFSEATILRDELALMVAGIPESLAQSQGVGSPK